MKVMLFSRLLSGMVLGFLLIGSAQAGIYQDFAGKEKAISEYAGDGKWRIVMIWASDCHVCNQEAHAYIKFHEQHKNKDARMLGISLDGQEKIKEAQEFIKRHGVSFPNLIGEPQDVAIDYMTRTGADWIGTPTFMVFNPQGKLVAADAGAIPVSIIEKFITSTPPANQK